MEIDEDTTCYECKREEATYLLFWKKIYPDMGEAILDPSIICEICKQKFTGSLRFFERRPVLIGFEELAKKDDKHIRLLFSKKACNHLSFPFWRRKVWRVRYMKRKEKENDNSN